MTGSRPDTWMPFYWADYWKDTGHLSATEHGGYFNLIGAYWVRGGALPDDDGALSRLARMTGAEWRKAKAVISAYFQIAEGVWRHGRIEDELQTARERYGRLLDRSIKANKERHKVSNKNTNKEPNRESLEDTQLTTHNSQSSIEDKKASEADASALAKIPVAKPEEPKPEPERVDIPLHLLRADGDDWAQALFRQGLGWLASTTGLPPDKHRSLLGKWLKSAGGDHKRVFDLLARAQIEGIADPRSWVTAALAGKKTLSHEETLAAIEAGIEEAKRCA